METPDGVAAGRGAVALACSALARLTMNDASHATALLGRAELYDSQGLSCTLV